MISIVFSGLIRDSLGIPMESKALSRAVLFLSGGATNFFIPAFSKKGLRCPITAEASMNFVSARGRVNFTSCRARPNERNCGSIITREIVENSLFMIFARKLGGLIFVYL